MKVIVTNYTRVMTATKHCDQISGMILHKDEKIDFTLTDFSGNDLREGRSNEHQIEAAQRKVIDFISQVTSQR